MVTLPIMHSPFVNSVGCERESEMMVKSVDKSIVESFDANIRSDIESLKS